MTTTKAILEGDNRKVTINFGLRAAAGGVMMRSLALGLLCLSIAACAPKGKYDVAVDDDRFDLLALHMPDILASDAKKCITGAPLLRGQGGDQDSISEKVFESVLDLWQVVDVSFLSNGEDLKVLPDGGDPKSVESIFPNGIKLPAVVANACGEYAGEVAVYIGLVSVSDSIQVALKNDPEVFEKMEMSTEQVMSGVKLIEKQAAALDNLTIADRVQCAAIFEAAGASDENLAPYATIWRAALVRLIEAGDLDPKSIREQSKYWQILAEKGSDAVLSADGYQQQAEKCDGWINEAIASQAAQ